jgi:hypothetical protein
VYQKIGGFVEGVLGQNYHLEDGEIEALRLVFPEMAIQAPGDRDQLRREHGSLSDDEPDKNHDRRIPQRKKRKMGYQEKTQLQTIQILKENPIAPCEAIVKTEAWRDHENLRFKTMADREIKAAISSYKNSLTGWSMLDYQKMYNNEKCVPIFSAGYCEFEKYYYNVHNSLKVMDELIDYQFDSDHEAILDFVTCLFNVLERNVPKLNTIVIHSAPSAGKNFFFDAVKDYYLNVGHIGNPTKYNGFPFQDAEGRRLLMWNEPNYSPEKLEEIKSILGGDTCTVKVKHLNDTVVYRTPVIVLTNNCVSFMEHNAFVDRIRVFQWQEAPFLREYDKKPNPLAVYHFFKKYNLVE